MNVLSFDKQIKIWNRVVGGIKKQIRDNGKK